MMKQTVTININSILYHIDYDAYEVLKNYLDILEKHFSNETDSKEIMADIEARISELLIMKSKQAPNIIQIADVDDIISIMGKPEDFGIKSEKQSETKQTEFTYKRLFRDEDNRVLGGVCSGIAYYFNVDVVLIRVLACLSFFIAGPLLYLGAWIIIPKARTTHDKIYMRGEKIDIESIKQRVKEGFENVKEDTRSFVKKNYSRNKSNFFFLELGSYLLKAVLTITLVACIAVILAFTVGFSFQWVDFSAFVDTMPVGFKAVVHSFFANTQDSNMAFGGLALILSIPFLLIIWGIVAILLGRKKKSKLWGYIIFIIWVSGLCILGFSIFRTSQDFSYKHTEKQTYSISSQANKTFVINQKGMYNLDSCVVMPNDIKHIKDWAFINCKNNMNIASIVDVEIKTTPADSITIEVYETAYGKDKQSALKRTNELIVKPQLTDSTLSLYTYITLSEKQQWRKQKVQVIVYLPKNQKYEEFKDKLYDTDCDRE